MINVVDFRGPGRIYVVAVAPGGEDLVRWELEDLGFVAYAPIALRWRRLGLGGVRSRKVEVRQPVIPGYVFVWSTNIQDDLEVIQGVRRVAGVLGNDGKPKPVIDERGVAAVLMTEVMGLFDYTSTTKPKMTLSQRVRVIGGMWQGREGVVVELLDRAGTEVRVQVDGARAMGRVRLKSDKLEAVLTARANK